MLVGITGHRGVLGSIIKQQLSDLHIPYIVFQGDVTKPEDIDQWLQDQRMTHIIHLAALVAVDSVNKNFAKAILTNVQGSVNVIEAVQRANIQPHFFYASTCHVYKSSDTPLKESDPVEPINNYGMTKYIAEVLLEYHANRIQIPLCIGRIFSFYHHTQKVPFLYPNILRRFAEENLDNPFPLRGALSVRDLSNAELICDRIIKLVLKNAEGVFNIGSGKGTTIQGFVQSLAPRPLTFDIDKNEKIHYLVADISKLKSEIALDDL